MQYLSFSLLLSLSHHLSLENDERNTNHSAEVVVQRNNSLIFLFFFEKWFLEVLFGRTDEIWAVSTDLSIRSNPQKYEASGTLKKVINLHTPKLLISHSVKSRYVKNLQFQFCSSILVISRYCHINDCVESILALTSLYGTFCNPHWWPCQRSTAKTEWKIGQRHTWPFC